MAYQVNNDIERLLAHGRKTGMINKWDLIHVRNSLYEALKVQASDIIEPINVEEDEYIKVLSRLLDFAYETGLIEGNTTIYRDLFDAKLMGLMMPRQSEIVNKFETLSLESKEKATDYFYGMSQASNYIRTDRIKKNKYWQVETAYGGLEITINLSKPEKDPKAIAAALKRGSADYPKCLLCKENIGFPGHVGHPARQNHRVIPLELAGEQWYYQYSPYLYYNEHAIAFSDNHKPMKITKDTFKRLLSFVDQFPHYFAGSNADLPIVGGSILSHDHFQCGRHTFAMDHAQIIKRFTHDDFNDLEVHLLKWPLSVVRLRGKSIDDLVELGHRIFEAWQVYEDADLEIQPFTYQADEKIAHNTVTPITRYAKGCYELDLVLRNNRQTASKPFGIFHPDKELHHIKKENIGLIEVMGLAILPGRLDAEIEELIQVAMGLVNEKPNGHHIPEMLEKHHAWLEEIISHMTEEMTYEDLEAYVKESVGIKYRSVLEAAGVFKQTPVGFEGYERFMAKCGLI